MAPTELGGIRRNPTVLGPNSDFAIQFCRVAQPQSSQSLQLEKGVPDELLATILALPSSESRRQILQPPTTCVSQKHTASCETLYL